MSSAMLSPFNSQVFVNVPDQGIELEELPMYGDIMAGFPSPALDYDTEELDLEELLFGSTYKKVIFRVRGDSMVEAGIFEGDFAIVERGVMPKIDDIVIAFIDGKYSIKYLQKDKNDNYYLKPANKNYKNIYPEEELEIFGVVTSVVRKLRKG